MHGGMFFHGRHSQKAISFRKRISTREGTGSGQKPFLLGGTSESYTNNISDLIFA